MKKAFKIKKHNKSNERMIKNLTHYENFEIKKIRLQRLQEYGTLSLISLLGVLFLAASKDNNEVLQEWGNNPENFMRIGGGILSFGGIAGSIVNAFRNDDRTERIRRLKKRREEIIENINYSKKRN